MIEVNLDPTPQSHPVYIALRGRAKDLVPLLLQAGEYRLELLKSPDAMNPRRDLSL